VLLWGYSEGGRNAAWAAELQPTYAAELPLLGVAAGGVPADLYQTALAIDGGPFSGLNLAVLVGLANAYDDPELWSILSSEGLRAAREAETQDVVGLVLGFPEPLATWTRRSDPWDDPAWRLVLDRERNGAQAPTVPAYLYHVTDDEIVPAQVGRDLARLYRLRGGDVTWVEVRAPDHLSGAHRAAGAAVVWLVERLAEHHASARTRGVA
jgi:pimeloyl-ACP methyl ester carboxylesterase